MSDRIEINFTANVREVMRGTDQISDSLKDTERDLTDLGDQGEQSLEQITDAQKETEKGAQKLSGTVAGELSSAFSSFDGTAQSAVEGVAQSVAGLSALIPGVGGLVGAGLGTALSEGVKLFSDTVDEEAKASEDRIQAMYDKFLESGLNYFTEQQVIDASRALTGDTSTLDRLRQQAKDLGVEITTVIDAQVQAGESRNGILSLTNQLIDEANQKLADGTYTDGTRLTTLESIRDEYAKLNGEQKDTVAAVELQRDYEALVLGINRESNEEIQKRNKLLAETPKEVPVKLVPDDTELTNSLARSRTLRVNLEGYVARSGYRVI